MGEDLREVGKICCRRRRGRVEAWRDWRLFDRSEEKCRHALV